MAWPGLFQRWIKPSIGWITIQRIDWFALLTLIHWRVIYPVESVIHLSNNHYRSLELSQEAVYLFSFLYMIVLWLISWMYWPQFNTCKNSAQIIFHINSSKINESKKIRSEISKQSVRDVTQCNVVILRCKSSVFSQGWIRRRSFSFQHYRWLKSPRQKEHFKRSLTCPKSTEYCFIVVIFSERRKIRSRIKETLSKFYSFTILFARRFRL